MTEPTATEEADTCHLSIVSLCRKARSQVAKETWMVTIALQGPHIDGKIDVYLPLDAGADNAVRDAYELLHRALTSLAAAAPAAR